jgi:hypothetical protein
LTGKIGDFTQKGVYVTILTLPNQQEEIAGQIVPSK